MANTAPFQNMEIQQVEIIGTLDTHTCKTCGDLDGHILKRKDVTAGVTAPPFHPNCQCVIVPYNKELAGGETRAARDSETEKTVDFPAITYKNWYNEYVKPIWKSNERGEIIKSRIIPEYEHYHSQPRGKPNEIVMHFGADKQHDFDFYDSNGFLSLQIHCGDHGNSKMHPFPFNGAHAADWKWVPIHGKWKFIIGKNRPLTEQERRWVHGDLKP